jgi:hypothetical protein
MDELIAIDKIAQWKRLKAMVLGRVPADLLGAFYNVANLWNVFEQSRGRSVAGSIHVGRASNMRMWIFAVRKTNRDARLPHQRSLRVISCIRTLYGLTTL